MKHRHLNPHEWWSKPKIDDILDRGNLLDWDELRDVALADRDVARDVLAVARATNYYGTSRLWEHFILKRYPEFRDV